MGRSDLVAFTCSVGLLFLLIPQVSFVQAKWENKLGSLGEQDLQLFEFTPSQYSRLPWAASRAPWRQGFIRKLVAENAPSLRPSDWSYEKWVTRVVSSSSNRGKAMSERATGEPESAPIDPREFLSPEFYLTLQIGTPPQTAVVALDTGSELTWVECLPCDLCNTTTAFDPTKSSTYSKLPCANCTFQTGALYSCDAAQQFCGFTITYGGGSQSVGSVATDNLVTAPVPDKVTQGVEDSSFIFGCGSFVFEQQSFSILGLDRGPLSLANQLGEGTFSICLPPSDGEGFIYIGPLPSAANSSGLQFQQTPMLANPAAANGSFYYIGVTGIAVGGSLVDIPESVFAIQAGTLMGGVILDCGTTLNILVPEISDPLKAALEAGTTGLARAPTDLEAFAGGMGPCYVVENASNLSASVPSFALHLEGGAVWEIPHSNIVFALDDPLSVFCYAFTEMGQPGFSILGNRLQQGFVIEHHVQESVFSISSYTDCSLAAW